MTTDTSTPGSSPGAMMSSLFEHEMVGTGRTLARDHGVKVVFEGSQAKTDGNTIVFPAMPSRELSQREVMIGRGYVDHESAHKRYTDFAAGAAILSNAKADPLRAAVLQGIEDGRIEAKNIQDYPGSAKNLRVLADAMGKAQLPSVQKLAKNPKTDWRMAAAAGIAWASRKAMGNGSEGEQALLDALPPAVRSFCEAAAVEAINAKSTRASVKLANELADYLGTIKGTEESFEEKPKPGEGEGEGEGKGGKATKPDSEAEGGGEAAPEGTESGDMDGGEKDEKGGGHGASTGEMPDPPELNFEPLDPAKLITNELGTTDKTRAADDRHTVISKRNDQVHHAKGESGASKRMGEANTKHADRADSLVATMAGKTAVIARKLELMLLDDQRAAWEGGRRSGRLDKRSLVRAGAFGAEDVFTRKVEEKRIEAAVSVLVDMSGSMSGGGKDAMARNVMLILAQALDRTGVPFEVNGFSSRGNGYAAMPSAMARGGSAAQNWGRTCRLDTFQFKGWDDTYRQMRGSMAAFNTFVGGDNPDPDAIIEATARLLKRPERKKILLTLSDGHPAYSHTMPWDRALAEQLEREGKDYRLADYAYKATKRAVEDAEKAGVRTVGIGILDDSVSLFYPRHAVINRLEDLAGETLDQIAQALLGDGRHVKAAA